MNDPEQRAMLKERENESWAEFIADPERRETIAESGAIAPILPDAFQQTFRTGWIYGFSSAMKFVKENMP